MFYVTLVLTSLAGLVALGFALAKSKWISTQDAGNETMVSIAESIQEGALAFLKREYVVLGTFVTIVAITLAVAYGVGGNGSPIIAVSFVVGAFCSALAGFFGMKVATLANVRTANAARTGMSGALQVAFSGGLVMGLCVVGLGILGLSILFLLYGAIYIRGEGAALQANVSVAISILSGFSLGASSIALFARVGGGIYTKAADVGADLAGKVYENIPEDDPRNPATIADNVGDNVGDVAGMGADLFESYVGSIIGTMVLGAAAIAGIESGQPLALVMLPLILAATGILVAIGGSFLVKVKEGGSPAKALNMGEFGAAGVMLALSALIIFLVVPGEGVTIAGKSFGWAGIFGAVVTGLVAGLLIGLVTEYYCSTKFKPTYTIAKQSLTGSATNIIAGLGIGMYSTGLPILILAGGLVLADASAGLYGIAIAAVGLLSVMGIQLAVDAYGPISDNAGGIAEMAELPPEVRERTDELDAVGNTTAAIGKGFAIGSAALT
ncbi:MAG: sodium-translocating pyrophosphatase, partial [Planctomycetota bacterium]